MRQSISRCVLPQKQIGRQPDRYHGIRKTRQCRTQEPYTPETQRDLQAEFITALFRLRYYNRGKNKIDQRGILGDEQCFH